MRFYFLTVVSAAGLVVASASYAQDRNGAPNELIGYFGKSPEQCQSYHRKSDDISHITKSDYQWCGGSACGASVVSHRRSKDTFTLRFRSPNNPEGWTAAFKMIDENIFEHRIDGFPTETLVRCTERDQIAGIGRDTTPPGLTKSLDAVFSAYYALGLPQHCSNLEVDRKIAEQLVEVGTLTWIKFILETQKGPYRQNAQQARKSAESQRGSAEYALREDASTIRDFCNHAASAFGPDGTVIKDLVKDKRRKA
ncbi:hypothetical protein IC232_31255 [Microvirga sp. BT688]|uniref:hypothetical protein n=1 Tax=Microvirga sp. TaxID=1873136 RepID=UPI0016872683|nr:hypothetical protein [Microvirga sp.]MBD2751112.1 hypothetical protein [Microvirga sp.]